MHLTCSRKPNQETHPTGNRIWHRRTQRARRISVLEGEETGSEGFEVSARPMRIRGCFGMRTYQRPRPAGEDPSGFSGCGPSSHPRRFVHEGRFADLPALSAAAVRTAAARSTLPEFRCQSVWPGGAVPAIGTSFGPAQTVSPSLSHKAGPLMPASPGRPDLRSERPLTQLAPRCRWKNLACLDLASLHLASHDLASHEGKV